MRLFQSPSVRALPVQSPVAYPPDEIKTASPGSKKRPLHIRTNLQTKSFTLSENASSLFSRPFQVRKFWDNQIAISYKENYIDGRPSRLDINEKLIQRQEKKHALQSGDSLFASGCLALEAKYDGHSLEKSPDGQWRIKDHNNNTFSNPEPHQSYIFVTMPSGMIRVSTRSKDGHLSLSGLSRYVRFAGEVIFDKNQRIISWNNASYAYCPAPFLASQARFGDVLNRFQPVVDRNSPEKQTSPIFSPR